MDVLRDKKRRADYDALSRYEIFSYYFHSLDEKFIYGITNHLSQDIEFVLHTITEKDTLDNLSLKYYGRPDYFWIIADFNNIKDPFKPLFKAFREVKIPNMGQLSFGGI